MKLKLDENLSRYLKPSLSAYQHVVMTAADEGLLAQPDLAVAATAKSEGRMLFTLDVEFGERLCHVLKSPCLLFKSPMFWLSIKPNPINST